MDTSLPYSVAYCGLFYLPRFTFDKLMLSSVQSGMALVLVEGEDRLQTLVGSSNHSAMNSSITSGSSLPNNAKVLPLLSTIISFVVFFVVG